MNHYLRFLGFAAMLLPAYVFAQCTTFYDGFESGTFNTPTPWTMGTGAYTMTVPNTSAAVGTYNLNMSCSTSNSFYQGPMASFTAGQPTYVSWWAKTNTTSGANGYFVLGDASTATNNGILFCYFNASSQLRFFNTTGFNYTITPNTWYHIEARNMNWTTRTMDIYVNNVLILTAWAFRSTTTTAVDRVYLHSLVAASVDYDDILIGGLPVTATSTSANVICNGGSNGQASVTASGGNGVYSYSWAPSGGTAASATGLTSGTYTCTITDGLGCTGTQTVTVTEPPALTATSVTTNVSCNGGSNGAIDLTPSGGTPGYTFLWSNGAGVEDISGIIAGSYSVTISDANGCSSTFTATAVSEPIALTSSVSNTMVSCPGSNNGTVAINVNGGTAPYTYLWSEGSTTSSVSGLISGTYTCDVTDANGCTTQNTVTVTEPPAFVTSVTSTDALCNGASNGTASINVSGGTPGYSYMWSNGDITSNPTSLVSGVYTCTVTDVNGCTTTNAATIAEPTAITATVIDSDVTCNSACDGAASITPNGGTAPYTYMWSNSSTTSSLNGLCAGTYVCIITDANGCAMSVTVVINAPAALTLSLNTTDPTSCFNPNGSIDLTVTGGSPAYTYSWSNSSTTEDVSGLSAGSYSVTVTDSLGCTNGFAVSLIAPAPPLVTLTLPMDTICTLDAAMALAGGSPSGGSWSGTGVTGSSFDASVAGPGSTLITYSYTDPNTGCSANAASSVFVSTCVGIAEETANAHFDIYPNPNNGTFTILNPGNAGTVTVIMYNAIGEVTGTWMMNASTMIIDAHSLSAGIYFLQLNSDSGKSTVKMIKE